MLPLYDNNGQAFEQALYLTVKTAFTRKFGGVTAYVRSPAEGAWHGPTGAASHDEIVIFEVMTERLRSPLVAKNAQRAGPYLPGQEQLVTAPIRSRFFSRAERATPWRS